MEEAVNAWFEDAVRAMSLEDVLYFFLEKSNLLDQCSPDQLRYLQRLYPELEPVRVAEGDR